MSASTWSPRVVRREEPAERPAEVTLETITRAVRLGILETSMLDRVERPVDEARLLPTDFLAERQVAATFLNNTLETCNASAVDLTSFYDPLCRHVVEYSLILIEGGLAPSIHAIAAALEMNGRGSYDHIATAIRGIVETVPICFGRSFEQAIARINECAARRRTICDLERIVAEIRTGVLGDMSAVRVRLSSLAGQYNTAAETAR